jgi:hypothetical protein
MEPCPLCGSRGSRRDPSDKGVCRNVKHCDERRCMRRRREDRKRFVGVRWKQCPATTTPRGTSIRFCELGEGHKGKHLNGTREWGGDYSHPLGQAFHALRTKAL